ncbi:MAG: hypothetical protein H0W36_05060 [Gemmatimonadetes bacterium]|nr:hypothetical protein [Gemmatimonadota bacterium]
MLAEERLLRQSPEEVFVVEDLHGAVTLLGARRDRAHRSPCEHRLQLHSGTDAENGIVECTNGLPSRLSGRSACAAHGALELLSTTASPPRVAVDLLVVAPVRAATI